MAAHGSLLHSAAQHNSSTHIAGSEVLPVRPRASDRTDGARWRRCVRRAALVLQGRRVMYPALDRPPARVASSRSTIATRSGGALSPHSTSGGMPSRRAASAITGRSMFSAWARPSSRVYVGGRSSRESSAGRRKVPSRPGSQASRSAAGAIADLTFSRLESLKDARADLSTTPATSRRFGASRTFQTYSARAWLGWRSANSSPSISAPGSNPSRPRSFRPNSTVMTT